MSLMSVPPVGVVPNVDFLLSGPVLLVEKRICFLFGLLVLFLAILWWVAWGLEGMLGSLVFTSLLNINLLGVCSVTAWGVLR